LAPSGIREQGSEISNQNQYFVFLIADY